MLIALRPCYAQFYPDPLHQNYEVGREGWFPNYVNNSAFYLYTQKLSWNLTLNEAAETARLTLVLKTTSSPSNDYVQLKARSRQKAGTLKLYATHHYFQGSLYTRFFVLENVGGTKAHIQLSRFTF